MEDVQMSASMTDRILVEAQKQRDELAKEAAASAAAGGGGADDNPNQAGLVRLSGEYIEDDGDDLDEADMRALAMFMSPDAPVRRNLAEIIYEKIQEGEEAKAAAAAAVGADADASTLSPKVVEVYTAIGVLLRRYRSGKLPRAFKIIPSVANWEDLLVLTAPQHWTPNAHHAATKIFASNFNVRMAQRVYNLVLLPKVRDDIAENKKLNYHLYMALKKAMFKPAAFFKGILLPLVDSQNCTLLEARIIGSVLVKVSIPMMHSAATILKLAEMEYSGACSIFLRILLDKKYSLPFRVIDALVAHFVRFMDETRELPVLWHQALLVFAQRYKTTMTRAHKDGLKLLLRRHNHPQISEEIRRELFRSRCRDDPVEAPSAAQQAQAAAVAAQQAQAALQLQRKRQKKAAAHAMES
jgi:essential nuclear protein 1